MDREELRKEIALIIWEHIDELAILLEREFVKDFPRATANTQDVRVIHEGTLNVIEGIANALDSADPSLMCYKVTFGNTLEDPRNPRLTLFASFLSTIQWEAHLIAQFVFKHTFYSGSHAWSLLEELERCVQTCIEYNCTQYAKEMRAPGRFIGQWDVMLQMRTTPLADDSPAKRHMSKERYGRLAKKGPELFTKPEGDALSTREVEVLELLVEGMSNAEIAAILEISENTVKNHVSHVFDKYNVNSRTELTVKVLR